ncbi:dienelactone hydrolase family protein [Sphingobium lactosutens]|uniref:dienelactone hydrolase family protein n=1 Tax=Sphingobium lactosutens TaxID=522773 RepID=UPI0015BBC5AA|nr:dienelactone hydrolase family protein [Sphingobium lactosutens]NWK97448.1 dienelactone hydrolase family protein [Sphingobium lactosutens]
MTEQRIEYRDTGGDTLVGYLYLPEHCSEPVPGVAVVPEAPGSGPMPRKRAEMLAGMGFAALVVDLYGDGLFTGYTPEANDRAQSMLANPGLLLSRVEAGVGALADRPEVDAKRMAAIGYCLGGKGVLDLARSGKAIKAVVAFHGLLTAYRAGPPPALSAKILLLTGARDPLVPTADVSAFCEEMTALDAEYRVTIFGKVGHAFTSFEVPRGTMPAELGDFGFDAEADALAWAETVSFLTNEV